MALPKIAYRKPAVLELEPGNYHWCACGESKNQPFCDGSHRVTDFKPVSFDIIEKGPIFFVNVNKAGINLFVTVPTEHCRKIIYKELFLYKE